MVPCHVRDLEAVCHRVMRGLAKAGVVGKRRLEDTRGQVHEIEGTVYGGKVLLLIEAVTKIPLAVNGVPIQAHEARWTRALVTQARANGAGEACLYQVVCDRGFVAGPDRWWLEPPGIRVVVPAKDPRAVTAEARALAAAGAGGTVGPRVPRVRPGQGRTASRERRETAVVGSTGLTTSEPDGTEAHGRHHHRRDGEPNPITVVVVRTWHGRD
jgi:hypothetical protein